MVEPLWSPPPWADAPPVGWLEVEEHRKGVFCARYPVTKPVIRLGRQESCDIPCAHPSVSRSHAVMVFRQDGSAYILDTGSAQGTHVGRKRLPPQLLVPLPLGLPFRLGASSRQFALVGSVEAQQAATRRKTQAESNKKRDRDDGDRHPSSTTGAVGYSLALDLDDDDDFLDRTRAKQPNVWSPEKLKRELVSAKTELQCLESQSRDTTLPPSQASSSAGGDSPKDPLDVYLDQLQADGQASDLANSRKRCEELRKRIHELSDLEQAARHSEGS